MTDHSALADKLAALLVDEPMGEKGTRLISKGGVPEPMLAILKEINDTVLERDLEFVAGDKSVNLIVAGCRLRGIQAVAGGAKMDTDALGKTISREEPELVGAVHKIIAAQVGDATTLTVRSLAPAPFGKGGERGISAGGLAELWNVSVDETPAPPMDRFLAATANAVTGMMHMKDGKAIASTGDIDMLQSIWDTQLTAFQDAHQKSGKGGDPQLICLEGTLDDGSATALAFAGSEVTLVIYQPDQLGALHASWQSIFG